MAHTTPRHSRIVLEHHQPLLVLGPLEQRPLRLEGPQRFHVVPHDPGQRQMMCGRAHIAEKTGDLRPAIDYHRLVVRHMTRREHYRDPRHDLTVAFYEVEPAGLED